MAPLLTSAYSPRHRFVRRYVWPVVLVGLWVWFFVGPRGRHSPFLLALLFIAALIIVVPTILGIRSKAPIRIHVLNLFVAVAMFIGLFAGAYWSEGNAQNFSEPLSRLDAVYITVGTLTTAGTGTFTAQSEGARAMQLIEMLIGPALILVSIAAVVHRYVTDPETPLQAVPDPSLDAPPNPPGRS